MEENLKNKNTTRKKSWWFRILKFVFYFFFFILFLIFLLNLSPVQNLIVKKVASDLSNQLDANVDLDHVNISLTKGIVLENFSIAEEKDTLISCKQFSVSLKNNLLNILRGSLSINSIGVEGASLHIVTASNENVSNLGKLLSKLSSGEGGEPGDPITLDVSEIVVEEVKLTIESQNKGTIAIYELSKAILEFDELDLANNVFDVDRLILDHPVIKFRRVDEDYSKDVVGVEPEISIDSLHIPLNFSVDLIDICGGVISYDNELYPHRKEYGFDRNHFRLDYLNVFLDNVHYQEGDTLGFNLERFDFVDDKGFEMPRLAILNFQANNSSLSTEKLLIETMNSEFENSIDVKYKSPEDLFSLSNRMLAKIDCTNSKINVSELAYFIPGFSTSKFYLQNKGLEITWSGKISGRPKSFSGRNFELAVGERLKLDGNFSTRNINDFENTLLNLNIKSLNTSISFLRELIPEFNPPNNFDKLGQFEFSGRFDGFFKDFVAFGTLDTKIGLAKMDMRLDVKEGVERGKYSGEIDLIDFDLGVWSDNPKLGLVNFSSKVDEGVGLTSKNASADLLAKVNSLMYNNYNYKDFVLDGYLENNKFNGSFVINDENLNVIFDGNIDASQEKPILNFTSKINQLDFEELNFSNSPLSFKGDLDVNLVGSNIDDIVGDLRGKNFFITKNDSLYTFDSLIVKSLEMGSNVRKLNIKSDFGSLGMEGDFKLSNFGNSLKKIFEVNYKYPAEILKIHAQDIVEPESYRFDLEISDSKNVFDLLGIGGLSLKNFKAKGGLNTIRNELDFAVNTPLISIKDNLLHDVQILANSSNEKGDILISIDSSRVLGVDLNTIDMQAKLYSDTASILFTTFNLTDSIERFDLLTTIVPHEKGYEVKFQDEELMLYGKKWKLNPDNKVVFGKNYHEISNLQLTDSKRFVEIGDVNNAGLDVRLKDFEVEMLNPIINYDKMDFSGKGQLSINIDNLYIDNFELTGNALVPNFFINGDSYGALELDVTRRKSQPIEALFSLRKDDMQLKADAYYSLDSKKLNSTVKAKSFPLKIFEYMLYEGITETVGTVDVDAEVSGPVDNLDISGGGIINDGGVKIIYLGTKYFFDNQRIKLTEQKIDMTGAIIKDELGGEGVVTGGLVHNVFRDFRVDANITGQDVLVLNTTKEDNPVYYGRGKGEISVDFGGESFSQVDMKIVAKTGPGSELSIPIEETQLGTEESFIKFVTQEDVDNAFKVKDEEEFKIEGLSIEMNLSLTDDLKVNLIFDEERGDIISGNGNGDLRVVINRIGDFDIFGEYEIQEGQYLFTALGLVNKYFTVRNGGKVIWTGDPINATLDIKADYSTRSSLSSFIAGFNADGGDAFDRAARASHEVDLILNLGGTLYSPEIQFDMDFPNLTSGELKTAVENKMIQLRENVNELNNQVVGLIVFNSFIPSSALGPDFASQSFLQSAGISTLSEFLSSQVSQIVTSFLSASLEENGLISDIDFDINVRNTGLLGVDASNSIAPNEIEVRLNNKFRFLDERLEFQVGGNYVRESAFQNQNYIVPDFVIQYYLTEDRKLKLRLYGKYDYDVIENFDSRNQKYGLGLGYSTEFGSLYTLKKVISEKVVKEN